MTGWDGQTGRGQPLPPLDLDTKQVPGVCRMEDLAIAAEGRWGPSFGSPCLCPPSSRPGASIYSVTVFVRGAPLRAARGCLAQRWGHNPLPLSLPTIHPKTGCAPSHTRSAGAQWRGGHLDPQAGPTWALGGADPSCPAFWGCFPGPVPRPALTAWGWLRTGGASGGSCSEETSGDPQTPQICCWGVFGAHPCPWGGPAC